MAGAQTVGMVCGFGEEDELRLMGADEILASTAELGRVLRGDGSLGYGLLTKPCFDRRSEKA